MDVAQVVVVAVLASIGPTLVGGAAWRRARSADKAVNNVQNGDLSLVETVHRIDRIVTPWFVEAVPGEDHIPLPAQVRILAAKQDAQGERITSIETTIEGITQ